MYVLPGALQPLSQFRQFILVQLSQAFDKLGAPIAGKTVKHPINPRTLMRHSAHDPAIWMDCESAAKLADSLPVAPGTLGWCVGFTITKDCPVGCLDLDECATADGWNAHAQLMMARLPGAVERSLSGQGLHIWFWYTGPAPEHGSRHKATHMELYTESRFMAFGTAASGAMVDATAVLPQFVAEWFPPVEADAAHGDGPVPGYSHIEDAEILRRAMAHQRPQSPSAIFGGGPPTASFFDLWTRNVAVLALAYPPDMGKEIGASDADFALAKELAYWTGKDAPRIERLMRQSALLRDKWDTHRTYMATTIERAIAFCSDVHKAKPILPPPPPASEGSKRLAPKVIDRKTFVGRESLAEIFTGCVYIQDNNEILLPNGDMVDQARFNAKFAGYTFCMDNANDKTTRSAWEAFLGNQLIEFPRAEGTAFDPRLDFQDCIERADRTWCNIYKRPTVDMREGDVKPFMDLLGKLLPEGDDALILLSYMAAVVQNPGVKFRWAPFLQGTQGNGKSTIVSCLRHALGNRYVFTVKAGMIENGFNSWLEHNMLYIADDIYSTRDRNDMMEALKSLITESYHAITLKGIDSIQKAICGNWMFTDNHKDAMKKQDESRRICTLYCAQQTPWDRRRDGLTKAFFVGPGGLVDWLKREGYAHVAWMLHHMEIDPRYNPAGECQEAPETSVTREAIIDGRTGVEHDIAEWIELEEPGFAGGFVSQHQLRARLEDGGRYGKGVSSPLKMKETMMRLGYTHHPALPEGRLPRHVAPDGTRPIVFASRESWVYALDQPELIATIYEQSQQDAATVQVKRKFGGMI